MKKHPLITLFVIVLATFSGALAHANSGGPDSFGYSFIDSDEPTGPVFDFNDISASGNLLPLMDGQMSGAVAIGFPFSFYGTVYTQLYVSNDGFLTFLGGQNCCTSDFKGEPIPTSGPNSPDAIIAGWWIDLDPGDMLSGGIYTETLGTAPNRVFIVQFKDIVFWNRPEAANFQFKLFEGSNAIEVHYDRLDLQTGRLDGSTAGIENQTGTVGLQYLNDEILDFPVAVRYSLPQAVDCGLEVTKSCFVAPPPAGEFGCNKPIDTLTMIWDPEDPSRYTGLYPLTVKAYKGSASQELLETFLVANPGVEVSVSGIDGKSNVTWEVLDSNLNLLGESEYHLSCSDDDLDGETDDPAFPQDCGKRQGNAKDNNGDLLNDWLLEGMVDSIGTLNCTVDTTPPGPGIPPQTECEAAGKGGVCTKRPTSISFRYHAGDDCMASSNNQGSGKWSCTDFGMTPDPAHITIGKDGGSPLVDDLDVADGDVLVGDKGSKYDSEIRIQVRNAAGGLVQTIKMHSSCSQELKIGDRFGALEIVGFTNEEQGTVGGGSVEVLYTYTVTNNGPGTLLVDSKDDKLGPLGLDFILPAGPGVDNFKIYTKTALLDETTTNVLTSTRIGDSGPDLNCQRTASATVTIAGAGPGPGPGPCSVSADNSIKIKSKKLEWKITNTGPAPAVIESIDLSWPAGNGGLKKIKLGGDKIVSKLESPGSAFITSFKGDAKKRTIKAGDTDTLKLEFRSKADKDPGKYSITVNFAGGCSAVF